MPLDFSICSVRTAEALRWCQAKLFSKSQRPLWQLFRTATFYCPSNICNWSETYLFSFTWCPVRRTHILTIPSTLCKGNTERSLNWKYSIKSRILSLEVFEFPALTGHSWASCLVCRSPRVNGELWRNGIMCFPVRLVCIRACSVNPSALFTFFQKSCCFQFPFFLSSILIQINQRIQIKILLYI